MGRSKNKFSFGFQKILVIGTLDITLLHQLFPSDLMDYFIISEFQTLCSVQTRTEYWLIDFREKNDLPQGYSFNDYETKDFMESSLIQDFPLRGKAVFLRIKKRRWRHKESGSVMKRDYSFIADGSKFTKELSDFLKDAGGYANRYHEQHSQLLWG